MNQAPLKRVHQLFAKASRYYYTRRAQPRYSRLLSTHLRKLYPDDELIVNTSGGFRMAVSPRDYISHRIFFYGEYDGGMSGVIRHHVWPGQTVWDIGAERGWFTLLMATIVGNEGRVDAFEAFPSNALKLKANVGLNSINCVNINAAAVSDFAGKMWFVPPSNEVTKEHKSLDHCGGVGYLTSERQADAIEVPTLTLDEYAAQTKCEKFIFHKNRY